MHNKKILLLPAITSLSLLFLFTLKIHAQAFSPLVKQFIKVQADTFALTDATIVDGTGGPIKHHQIILIEYGLIAAMGDAGSVKIPAGIKNINCTGKTIIPGMVMMHEHLFYGEHPAPFYLGQEMPVSFPQLYLAGGVTTMRTTGSIEPQTDLNIKAAIEQGKLAGPDIDVTGPYIERAGLPIPELLHIKSPEEAAKEVNYWADMGCTSFKLYTDITRADAKAAIDAAHQHGLKVTGHLCSVTYREAAALGIDNLEHGFWVCSGFDSDKKKDSADFQGQKKSLLELDEHSQEMKSLMDYLIKRNVTITSTLPVFMPFAGREIFPGGADSALAPEISKQVERTYKFVTATDKGKSYDSAEIVLYKKELFWEKQFADMGGKLMAGIDPTGDGRVIPGYADRIVPELLMEAGFTIPQAIKICSLNAAEYLGKEKETGSIAVGKKADLVLINGDIEADIKNMRNTEIVFKNGVGFDSKKIFDSVKGMVGLH
jgi:imidazolonepropionase-like amidohydrolase